MEYCNNCRKETLVFTDLIEGTQVCTSCGLVIEDHIIDETQEWRDFADEGQSSSSNRQRTGGIRNDNLADGGLSLCISGSTSKRSIKSARSSSRFATYTGIMNYESKEASQKKAHRLIVWWGCTLNLQKRIQNRAEEMFIKIQNDLSTLQGRSVVDMSAALLLAAAKLYNQEFNLRLLLSLAEINEDTFTNTYKRVKGLLNDLNIYIPNVESSEHCRKICLELDLPYKVKEAAKRIEEGITIGRYLDGKQPSTIAAVAVEIAVQLSLDCKSSVTLEQIAKSCGKSAKTIKESLKEVLPKVDKLIQGLDGSLSINSLQVTRK